MQPQWRFLGLVLGFTALLPSFVSTGTSSLNVITGTVVEWQAGQSITVANDQTNPPGVRFTLRNTVYTGDSTAIAPGVRVTVWYRMVGERRPVAARVSAP